MSAVQWQNLNPRVETKHSPFSLCLCAPESRIKELAGEISPVPKGLSNSSEYNYRNPYCYFKQIINFGHLESDCRADNIPMACARGDCTMQLTRIFVHVTAALMFGYSVYYDWNFVIIPPDVSPLSGGFGGKFKYLTFWDAVRLFAFLN